MSRSQVLIVSALGAVVFAASYAGGQTVSEDEAAAPVKPTPLVPASVGLPQLGKGAPLPRFRTAKSTRPAAPVQPLSPPEPEPTEPPVEAPVPPPPPPPTPAPQRPEGGGGGSQGDDTVIFDDSG